MTADSVSLYRRDVLIKGTSTLAALAVGTTAVPFLSSWQPTEATRLSGLPARIDLSKLRPGEGIKLLWRGTPMWVVRRPTPATDSAQHRELLKDPDSIASIQPPYALNPHRSRRADIIVLTAICTHLGCLPEFKKQPDADLDPAFDAGFYCPCHGSRFDLSGRVIKGSPATTNLPVPSYFLANEDTLVIGADGSG
jgi:ubiquinol-cytochrome c reductase iron-sulfur subunit